MSVIHMDSDLVLQFASQLEQSAQLVDSEMDKLISGINSLDWVGPSRDEYIASATALIRQIKANSRQGDSLSQRVKTEVAEWLDADQKFATGFHEDGKKFHFPTPSTSPSDRRIQMDKCWGSLSDDQKIRMIGYFFDTIVSGPNRPQINVEIVDKCPKGGIGEYNSYSFFDKLLSGGASGVLLYSRSAYFDPTNLAHEIRHALQHYYIENPDQAPAGITSEKIQEWKNNFDHYNELPQPLLGGGYDQKQLDAYANQPVEVDARNFGQDFYNGLMNHQDKFEQAKAFCDGLKPPETKGSSWAPE
jgi:hypothetical protein